MAPNQKPKWHRIARVSFAEAKKIQGVKYFAMCGYSYEFDIFEEPALRIDVKTKTLRCKDCDRNYEKEQNR